MEEKIALNIREIYGSADLDAVHIFAMKAAMQVQREGFYDLEAPAGTLADPDADGFLRLAVRLVADSPECVLPHPDKGRAGRGGLGGYGSLARPLYPLRVGGRAER